MPETPDFDSIARGALADKMGNYDAHRVAPVAERLRQVWNARGVADVATIEAELARMMGGTASGPYVKNLERAIKGLDR